MGEKKEQQTSWTYEGSERTFVMNKFWWDGKFMRHNFYFNTSYDMASVNVSTRARCP